MSASLVRVERYGGIAVVVLSRPEKRNAMTPAMLEEVLAAIPPADQIEGLVLAGDGPVFCGGFDLKMCHEKPGTLEALLRGLARVIAELDARAHPVVVAAQGAAIAGGAALLGGADVAVGDRAGQYGYPVVRLGLSPAVSAPYLRLLVGDGHARERLLDPSTVSGEEARRIGLIHELCDIPEDCGPRALRVCKMLAGKPRHAFGATKRLLRELGGAGRTARAGLEASLTTADSDECRAALGALFGAARA